MIIKRENLQVRFFTEPAEYEEYWTCEEGPIQVTIKESEVIVEVGIFIQGKLIMTNQYFYNPSKIDSFYIIEWLGDISKVTSSVYTNYFNYDNRKISTTV